MSANTYTKNSSNSKINNFSSDNNGDNNSDGGADANEKEFKNIVSEFDNAIVQYGGCILMAVCR